MKRILYVSDAISIHTRRWAEHFRDQGVDVHVASLRPATIAGTQVHVLPTFCLGRLGYFLAVYPLRRLARHLAPDVIHAQYVTSYGFLAALAGLRPLVLTAWGTDVLISPEESRLMRWFASYAVRHADAVTTVAQHMNAAVASLGAAIEDVSTIPFGVDTQQFVPPMVPRCKEGSLRLICTRNFHAIYSVTTLIAALHELALRGLTLQVDLVGDGPLRSALEAQVENAGLKQWITFHGHVDQERVSQLLAQAHVFVTPALSDGNNVSLNEAMACACFPIATNIPANEQWIENGVNGLLYPPGDAARLAECIFQAVTDADWRTLAGATNRQIIESRANWRVCIEKMSGIYARVMRNEKQQV